MSQLISILTILGSLAWPCILLFPWKPGSTRERLGRDGAPPKPYLSDPAVLFPARDEAEPIRGTVAALEQQGRDLAVIVIDDQSSDGTADLAKKSFRGNLRVLHGKELPAGWVGALWALEQGREAAHSE